MISPPDQGRLALNTATLDPSRPLEDAVEECERAGIRWIAPWRDQLHEIGLPAAARLISRSGLLVSGLCRGGMFHEAEARGRKAMLDDNKRAIEEAAVLGARCLILVVGGMPAGSRDLVGARARVEDAIATLVPFARDAGVPLAIEPLHPMYAADRACINTLSQALDLCDRIGPGVGVAVDVYHVWWDPSLPEQIERAGKERLLAFHLCDWLVPTRDLLFDRGMMGDGVIDLPGIRSWMEAGGYDGPYEVEIFSKADWWQRPGREVLATVRERFATMC